MLTKIQESPTTYVLLKSGNVAGEILIDLPEGKLFKGRLMAHATLSSVTVNGVEFKVPTYVHDPLFLTFSGPASLVLADGNIINVIGEIT
jgi:hypothetical protein